MQPNQDANVQEMVYLALLKPETAAMKTVRRVLEIRPTNVLFVRKMLREQTEVQILLHVSAIPVNNFNTEHLAIVTTAMLHV
jgi:chemotaxis response regulator CheB